MAYKKQWTFAYNQVPLDQTTGLLQNRSFVWQLYTFLTSNGWTVASSNNWTSYSGLVFNYNGSAHS